MAFLWKANIGYPLEITQCIAAVGFVDDIFKGISKKIIDKATPLIIISQCINDLHLLLSQNCPSKDKELSYILDIISNLVDFSKFAYDYIADIIADDDILHCINNALTSKQMNQCCNAVFAVNNILTFPDKTWLFYLLYWQQGCIISRFIDACKYLINNFNKLKYDYELRKRIGKRRIIKLSEIILKMNHNDTFNIKQIDLQSLR